jgi:hypothetical protein
MAGIVKSNSMQDIADEEFPGVASCRVPLKSMKDLYDFIFGEAFASSREPPVNKSIIELHKHRFLGPSA